MVSVGSKALLSVRARNSTYLEGSVMFEEDKSYKLGRRKKGMAKKGKTESFGFGGYNSTKTVSGRVSDGAMAPKKPQPSIIRKQVDPETAKYFADIANLFESSGVDLEERSVICGNALEEAKGKEFELATDYVISHTLQTLLDGCDLDHLCGFLQGCANIFPLISMDRSGSHVAETALKCLATHLEDNEAYSVVEETLTAICKVIIVNPVDMMCNCYGSHVLRSLLCLCGGVPLYSPEFHGAKSSTALASRLNLKASKAGDIASVLQWQGFPGLLKFLVSEMLNCTCEDIKTLLVDRYSSLVLQTALKLLAVHDQELLQVILILLGNKKENLTEGNLIEMTAVGDLLDLMKETAYSHLMEVILEVAPQGLYDEMFTKVFMNSLFDLSFHHCGNFVIQALVSHSRNQDQMEVIWKELGPKFKDLLEMGRSGVIASIIAASQRLHTHEQKCCQALSDAVSLPNESPRCIVPRLLFLESFFACKDKSKWSWPNGLKIHVMGSLILQAVLKFPSDLVQPYIASLISMEDGHVFEVAKDAGGARVIEAFLDSSASGKQKRRLIVKLRGHFGELAMNSSGSFTVEKCFIASNLSLREAITLDLLAMQTELSKTKQGPYLLRKLDIDGFAKRPDQWRSKQESKQSAYKEFHAAFGSSETKSSISESFLSDTNEKKSGLKDFKKMREDINHRLASKGVESNKKLKNKKGHSASNNTDGASGRTIESENQMPFLSVDMKGKKRHGKDQQSMKPSKKVKIMT